MRNRVKMYKFIALYAGTFTSLTNYLIVKIISFCADLTSVNSN